MQDEPDFGSKLDLISLAWGGQRGWCFFPWIDGSAMSREERIKSYHEGPAFRWPRDRIKVLDHMKVHWDDDLYWCPSLFEDPRRRLEFAMDEHALWADLDEVDPKTITDYPPTIAWETSPKRYQALWLIARGYDMLGASWQGGENHRLTTYLGADPGGWDTTQLLRIPGWPNHKPDRKSATGIAAPGRLLWGPRDRRRYLPNDFDDLPEVESDTPLQSIMADEVEAVDRRAVWERLRLKVSREVRGLISSKTAIGDRSEQLWRMERELADAGATASEIVAIVRTTVWNKYQGRNDELRRLVTEAAKAVAARAPELTKQLEMEREGLPAPIPLEFAFRGIKAPRWIVREIWTEGGCGFIAGQPKSFKSWMAFDLGLSVATGAPFLNHDRFRVDRPGPVLIVQEEDSLPTLKRRYDKIWPEKQSDRLVPDGNGGVIWVPPTEMTTPDVDLLVRGGMIVSEPEWQAWLDEALSAREYRLVILDPLMMMAGDVDEFKGAEVTNKIFRPLSQLSNKHNTAICIVHHMRKASLEGARGGQMMLGSTSYHAWAHDALYLTLNGDGVEVQRENKDSPLARFKITGLGNSRAWTPHASRLMGIFGDSQDALDITVEGIRKGRSGRPSKVLAFFHEHGNGPHTARAIAADKGITAQGVYGQLARLRDNGQAIKVQQGWVLVNGSHRSR